METAYGIFAKLPIVMEGCTVKVDPHQRDEAHRNRTPRMLVTCIACDHSRCIKRRAVNLRNTTLGQAEPVASLLAQAKSRAAARRKASAQRLRAHASCCARPVGPFKGI